MKFSISSSLYKRLFTGALLIAIVCLSAAAGLITWRCPSHFSVDAYAAVTGASEHIVAAVRSDFSGINLWGEVDIEGLPQPQPPDAVLDASHIDAMVGKAVELAAIDDGDLSAYFDAGDWVGVSVDVGNSLLQYTGARTEGGLPIPGGIADPRLVKSFIDLLLSQRGGKRISIMANAPSSFWSSTWEGYYDGLSYDAVIDELSKKYPSVTFEKIDMNTAALTEVIVPGADGDEKITYSVPEALTACDKIVSIAALKTHFISRVSMNIMNYMQFMAKTPRFISGKEMLPGMAEKAAVDIFAVHPPDFAVIDGILGLEVMSAEKVKAVRGNIILAGKDPVAVDAAGTMLLGINTWDVDHFHRAALAGIGTFDPDSIDLRGAAVKEVVLPVEKPVQEGSGIFCGRGLRRWLMNGLHEDAGLDDMPLADEPFLYPEPEDEEGGKTWNEYAAPDDYIDLTEIAGGSGEGVVYAYVRFLSSIQEEGFAWFDGNGDFIIYFNDDEVYRNEGMTRQGIVGAKIPVQIRRGYDHLLVKARRSGQEFGFRVHIASSKTDGGTMPGLKFLEP